jgi:hypothetical protein
MVMIRRVELVADYGPGDPAFDELVQRMQAALADVTIHPTRVPAGDTLEAGRCVARLALAPGAAGRVVVHDVAVRDEAQRGLCAGRTGDGALVVGRDGADCWSGVADALETLCTLELPLRTSPHDRADVLAKVIVRVLDRHPHAVREPVPRARFRRAR